MKLKYKAVNPCSRAQFCSFDNNGESLELSETYKRLDNDKLYTFLEDGCGCTCVYEIKGVLE